MNTQEITAVLTKVQAYDNRQVDEISVAAWAEAIGDLPMRDALEAVAEHFRSSTDYLQPAHVRAGCKRLADVRRERGVSADTSERAIRRCPWSSCRCTHTECTKGWLDREGIRLEGQVEYAVAIRCPECAKAVSAS